MMRMFTAGRKSLQKLTAHAADLSTKAVSTKPLPVSKAIPAPPLPASPSLTFFEKLKREEHQQKFTRKRVRFDFESNYTGALALPYSCAQLAKKRGDEDALLAMSAKYITEHANRRVDLFFYTLIAYYQTHLVPTEGHTTLQHGRGRSLEDETNLTQACHSSFIPSLLDETIYQNKKNKVRYKSLISGTHFLESLNSTVELPPMVNAFDDILESICRPLCIKILGEVSCGKINPIVGLTTFLNMMNTLLQDFKRQAADAKYSSLSHPSLPGHHSVHPKLIDLVINGTLGTTFSAETGNVNAEYVQLLLRMTPAEKALYKGTAKEKAEICFEKMLEIQNEILETESDESSCTI